MLVVIAGPAGDVVDGGAEVGEVVAAGPDDGHGQRLDLRGQFGADLAEGAVGVGGDEHALALGQEVCQEGGGGVCLAGARRALHQGLGVAVDAFEDATLAAVASEFNRFNTRKLELADAQVAQLRVGGNFRWAQAEDFVKLLELGFPVRAERHTDRIVLHSR